jgi:hypothetical protein
MEPPIQEEYHFNPKQYYWLFNPILKFNKRHGFTVENEIDPKDFLKMVQLNRRSLVHFIKKTEKNKLSLLVNVDD